MNNVEWYIPQMASNMIRAICPEKKLTKELAMLPLQEAKALFRGLINGDGAKRKDDNRLCFIQKDKETVDWFSVIAMRLGFHPIISQRKNGIYQVYLTKRTYIGIRNTNGKGKSLKFVDYKGIVWCPKTKYGTWIARRNGRIFITGNTYPEELCETPIKAGCPEFVCKKCGKAREKICEVIGDRVGHKSRIDEKHFSCGSGEHKSNNYKEIGYTDCGCNAGWEGGTVLDPFCGAGTTGLVAKKLNRNFIGIELNEEYIKIAERRINQKFELFDLEEVKYAKD